VLLRFDLVNAGLTIVVLNDKTYYWVWIAPDEQLSFKTTKLIIGYGLHRMNNCRLKRQNLNRVVLLGLDLRKRRMNNCRFKRQFLMLSIAAWVDLINAG
jgi:uncharacterized protein YjbI with pentapeptide repeats